MADSLDIPGQIEALLRVVNHEATSNQKYRVFERYLASVLRMDASDIYTAHVAKPGNFDVRMTQSKRARSAKLRIALIYKEEDFSVDVELAERMVTEDYIGTAVLVISDATGRWTPRWGIEPRITGEHPSEDPFNLVQFTELIDGFELRRYSIAQALLDKVVSDFNRFSPLLPSLPSRTVRDSFTGAEVPRTLYELDPDTFTNFIETDVTANDVVAIARRKKTVDHFRRLLEDQQYFTEVAAEFNGKKEKVWQDLLEKNPWILGVSLAGQLLTSWDREKLEQVVAGYSVSGPGKRVDALMQTSGRIRSLVFAEIKHHKTELLDKDYYRTGAWAPSSELSGGVVQIQQTVHLASRQIGDRLYKKDASGAPTVNKATWSAPGLS